jgi:predicted MFS family arabinose efflux permease
VKRSPAEASLTQRPSYRWVVLGTAFLSVFAALGFGRFGYSAVLPAMQKGLNISTAAAGSLASWNLIGYTVMSAVGGILSTRWGPRRVITLGILVTAAGLLFTGLVNTLPGASGARLVTGMGNGLVLVPSISLMANWFEARRLGLASAVVPTGSSLALVVVGLAVPAILAAGGANGWRWAWYFFAGVTLVVAVINVFVLRDKPAQPMTGDDELILDKSAPYALRVRLNPPSFHLGPVLRSGYAWHLGAVYLLYGVAFLLYFTFFQKRLTTDLGYSSQTAGYLFMLVGIAGLAGGIGWGSVSDRFGRERTLALTLFLAGVAGLLFGIRPTAPALILSAILFGSTGPAFPGLMGAACADRFGPKLASASLGLITIMVGVGQAVGPLIGGAMSDAFSSLSASYIFSGLAFLGGALTALLLPKGAEADRATAAVLPELPQQRGVK